MKPFTEFLAEKREITIHTLASYLRQHIQENWQKIVQEDEAGWHQLFDKAGDPTYGVYGRKLLAPVLEQFIRAGFSLETDARSTPPTNSVEYWGPPEERERCLWFVVKQNDGPLLGTLVTRTFHDHTQFRLPHAMEVLALEETETSEIITALSHASVRLGPNVFNGMFYQQETVDDAPSGWEYSVEVGLADCLDTNHPERNENMLEYSLSLWGHYGWELTAMVSHQQRLMAFFKRKSKGKAG